MQNKDKILISIVIPCYNIYGYLEPCLNSCILQTYENLEIILIDDGSKDETKEIIDFYAQKDNRIIPVHKRNEGVAKARQTGINKSSGEYIFLLDGDDYLPLNAIEVLLNEIISENADIAVGNILVESNSGFHIEKLFERECINSNDFIKKMLQNRIFTLWGKLYKRSLFSDKLNYHYDLKRGEDAALLIQLVQNSAIIKGVDKVIYYYRSRGDSVTHELSGKNFIDAINSRFIVENYAVKSGLSTNDFELCEFICFATVLILKNLRNLQKSHFHLKKTIKSKIKKYLLENSSFLSYYKRNFHKNYCRLIFYYYFSCPDRIFSCLYRIILFFKKRKRTEDI